MEKAFVKKVLYDSKAPTGSVIKGDCEHIAKDWAVLGFDCERRCIRFAGCADRVLPLVWEEVSGSHFYTLLSIHTGLMHGAKLAERLADPSAAAVYRKAASQIKARIQSFWSEHKQIIRVTLDFAPGRQSVENAHVGDDSYGKDSELDSAVLLATLHAGEGTEWYGSDQVIATLEALMDAMRFVRLASTPCAGPDLLCRLKYPLNKGRDVPALGRYPEDEYDGTGLSLAHPWYVCESVASDGQLTGASQVPVHRGGG